MIPLGNKITGYIKKYIQYSKKRKEIFPKILSIEFTSACNAKCIMCPQPEMDRKKENMSFDVLQKVVDDCKGKPLKKINLFWMGDSTVDKNMIEKIRIIRKIFLMLNFICQQMRSSYLKSDQNFIRRRSTGCH